MIAVGLSFLLSAYGTVGTVDLFRTEAIPAMFAMGITIWSIYFCFCKRWLLGYFFFGIICLLQFLIGVLPTLMMTVFLAIDAKKTGRLQIMIWPILVLGCFVSLLVGTARQ